MKYHSSEKETITSNMFNNKHVLVWFHADFCGHCKNMKGEWEKMRKKIMNDKNGDDNYSIIEIEQAQHQNVNPDITSHVSGFPTILYIKDGKVIETYSGERSATAMESWFNKFANTQSGGSKKGKKKRRTQKKRSSKHSNSKSSKQTKKERKKERNTQRLQKRERQQRSASSSRYSYPSMRRSSSGHSRYSRNSRNSRNSRRSLSYNPSSYTYTDTWSYDPFRPGYHSPIRRSKRKLTEAGERRRSPGRRAAAFVSATQEGKYKIPPYIQELIFKKANDNQYNP